MTAIVSEIPMTSSIAEGISIKIKIARKTNLNPKKMIFFIITILYKYKLTPMKSIRKYKVQKIAKNINT
ncbi:MAG: hypothetical protein KAR08_11830, partial [Candidatus Heimdallarchaeota archaeon]|nr:hypothetical protein [Candidatus Heimdallarchaeota archaeon]